MTAIITATIETLTAEVTTLRLGARKVSLSVAKQLDTADYTDIEPMGRVRIGQQVPDVVEVIGKHRRSDALVRSHLSDKKVATVELPPAFWHLWLHHARNLGYDWLRIFGDGIDDPTNMRHFLPNPSRRRFTSFDDAAGTRVEWIHGSRPLDCDANCDASCDEDDWVQVAIEQSQAALAIVNLDRQEYLAACALPLIVLAV